MGDDSSLRYRRDDEYASQAPSAAATPASRRPRNEDALAELARLIGDQDPFADFAEMGQDQPPPAPAPRARAARPDIAAAPQFPAPPVERRFEDWQPGRRGAREGAAPEATGRALPAEDMAPRARSQDPRLQDPRLQDPRLQDPRLQDPRGQDPRGQDTQASWEALEQEVAAEQSRTSVRLGYGSLSRRAEGRQLQDEYDPRPAAPSRPSEPPPPAARYADEEEDDAQAGYAYGGAAQGDGYDDYDDTYDPAYGEDGYMPPHADEVYETEPRQRKGRMALVIVACVVGIGVASAGGLFAYRMMGSGGSTNSGEPPPVIKADSAPTKVAGPTPTTGTDGQKLIYDRVGGAPGTERVVPREEQPMDVNAAAAAAAAAAGAAPAAAGTPSTEPKRVKTVAVRADGSLVENSASAPASALPPGIAPTAYAPTQNPLPTGAPAPKTVTTTAAVGAASAAAPAAAAPAAVANGAYVVQVSSQKSESDAMGSWKVLQGRYPQLLGSYKASVRRADLGDKGIYYRAQVGPFSTREEANNLCNALQAQGGTCIVTRN
ncbi:SPOR domain-containing protein [Roseixanthobacter glucoisosaccharinicivorans]|uniref:SPOR domain-containing protein n=1 Tax=Roseixanthobacter glucoisosaccharinicivorans TaxID=3119923 RepID=UPI00372B5B6A